MNRDESRRSKRSKPDRDFGIPNSDLIINDYDDERTLDEEEALEASEDTHNELSNLQKESDMPLKDLLVMYGYGDMSCQDPNKAEDEEDEEEDDEDDEEDDEEEDDDPPTDESDLKQFYTNMVKADENGASVTRPNTGKSDLTRNNDTSLGPNANAHATSAPTTEAKVEDDNSTGNAGTVTSENQATSTENVNSTNDSSNPTSTIPTVVPGPVTSSGGGGGGGGGSSRLLRSVSRPQSEEEEDDCDYSPDEEEWKKTIMVGSDYQAAIPEGLCRYDDALPYENVDKMLWDPSHISEAEVEEFLGRAQLPVVKGAALPSGSHVRDDEQALYLLLQCGYNLEEALRRRRMNVLPSTESVSLWSEEECHNFESGLRHYGKDFHLIQKNKVRTRSVGELVQFYYLWKKTERHDIFTCKARLEKKKYALHPGVTDYMDRFLDEQEGVRDRSSSPNVHCLIYGDAKRQRTNNAAINNEEQSANKTSENWEGGASTTTTTATTTTTTTTNTTSSNVVSTTDVMSDQLASSSDQNHQNRISSSPATAAQLDYPKVTESSNWPAQQQQRNNNNNNNNNQQSNTTNNNQHPDEEVTPAAADNIVPHLPP